MVASLDIVDREILDLERKKRIAERMVLGVRVEEFDMARREKRDRAGSSRVLEAPGREGLVQLYPTMRGLGLRC